MSNLITLLLHFVDAIPLRSTTHIYSNLFIYLSFFKYILIYCLEIDRVDKLT